MPTYMLAEYDAKHTSNKLFGVYYIDPNANTPVFVDIDIERKIDASRRCRQLNKYGLGPKTRYMIVTELIVTGLYHYNIVDAQTRRIVECTGHLRYANQTLAYWNNTPVPRENTKRNKHVRIFHVAR